MSPPPPPPPPGVTLNLAGKALRFDKTSLSAPAGSAITIIFTNNDDGVPHNLNVKTAGKTEIANGIVTQTLNLGVLAPGSG